jgi:hypothetical protein
MLQTRHMPTFILTVLHPTLQNVSYPGNRNLTPIAEVDLLFVLHILPSLPRRLITHNKPSTHPHLRHTLTEWTNVLTLFPSKLTIVIIRKSKQRMLHLLCRPPSPPRPPIIHTLPATIRHPMLWKLLPLTHRYNRI